MPGRVLAILVCALISSAISGCSSDAKPTPTGASCPPGLALTYDNFGQPFMESYCTRCHSSELRGSDRNGAPLYHDFDSLLGIVVVAEHVDEYTAAGPDSRNEIMPPNGAAPTLAERTSLGEWLACELERVNDRADAGPADAAAPDAMP